jgi:hypothetical protein
LDFFGEKGFSFLLCVLEKSKERTSMKKSNLPSKICTVCGLPYSWRKKWEKNWEEVKYCSERCRRSKDKNSSSY